MTELTVRRLLVDLQTEIPRRWAGGDAFRSASFNAFSMSFPVGEQFFIDSLRAGMLQLPQDQREEHRSTAFDINQALGGNHAWRVKWFRRVTLLFLTDVLRQTVCNLWHDGDLFRFSTWRSAVRTLFGRDGVMRCAYRPWRAYFGAGFHPRQQDDVVAQLVA